MSEPQTVSPARAYEDYFVPAIFGPLTDVVLGQAPPRPGEAVVDVACGTGVVARRAAWIAGDEARIVGVDRSPAMLEVARVEAQREGLSIDWHVGDAMALDLPDASFEVAYCQQGLQFLPDRTRGAAQLRRVLTDGGRAVVAVWQGLGRHPLFAALAEAEVPNLARFGVPVTYDDAVAPFSFGDPDDLGTLLDEVGFGAVEVTEHTIVARFPDPDRFVERLEYAYAAVVPQFVEDPAAFAAYVETIGRVTETIVAGYRHGDHIAVPLHANLAVTRG